MTYRISTVAEMTGIARNTLIAWERRYGFVRPQRRENGYRSYDENDVARILRVKNAVSAGLKISEAIQLLRASEKRRESDPPLRIVPQFQPTPEDFQKLRDELTTALISYRREHVEALFARVEHLKMSTRLREIYFPVLRTLGQLWEKGDIGIAQEHYASGLIRSNLAALLLKSPSPEPGAQHVACTTFPKEQHEIVALALAVQFSLLRKRVTYLGANMPVNALSEFCIKQRPDLLCISCIQRPSPDELDEYARVLEEGTPASVRIVLGGRALDGLSASTSRIEIIPAWEEFDLLQTT